MIALNLIELARIQEVCAAVGTEYFTLESSTSSGIGRVLTLTYDTEIADYPAKVTVEIAGSMSW